MEKISWNDSYCVGVPKLDMQHQTIVKLINILIENKDTCVDSEIISETLTRMTEYARDHFRDEEDYMLETGCPDFEAHKACHSEYRKGTVSFCMDTMKHQNTVPREILDFLKNWWTTHILEMDMLYSPLDSPINSPGTRFTT